MTLHSRTLTPAAAAARITPLLITLAALAIAAGGLWLWRNRQQIRAALVATAAATYAAGAWSRRQVEALATDSARLLPAQPVPALAPITATLVAVWNVVNRSSSDPVSIIVDSARTIGIPVRNISGVTIPKGSLCYQTGSSGTTITVALAIDV